MSHLVGTNCNTVYTTNVQNENNLQYHSSQITSSSWVPKSLWKSCLTTHLKVSSEHIYIQYTTDRRAHRQRLPGSTKARYIQAAAAANHYGHQKGCCAGVLCSCMVVVLCLMHGEGYSCQGFDNICSSFCILHFYQNRFYICYGCVLCVRK
jgi:hypothetical protein